ncbi:MAG: methyl-accepting chemotaxis protein [Verrucomicrobiota bacterium]
MNLTKLTIGRRVSLGFLLLLLFGLGLGFLAVWKMHFATQGARSLADAIAPQTAVASDLAGASALAQRSFRSYSFTGDADELAQARRHLAAVKDALAKARQLSAAHPELVALAEGVSSAEQSLDRYGREVDATVANLEQLADIRSRLDTAGSQFLQQINDFIHDQDTKMASEITEGLTAEKLNERRLKAELANDIVVLGNAIRVLAYKAQALRQPELMAQALPQFDEIRALRERLQALAYDELNQRQLKQVAEAMQTYRGGVEELTANFAESARLLASRTASIDDFDTVIKSLLERSVDRMLGYAGESEASLVNGSRLITGGLIAMLLTGALAAFIIIRGVNKALARAADSISRGALQVAAASGQVSSASQSLAEGSSEQAASLEEISSSIEELSSTTKRNAENADAGKTSAGHARAAAEEGAGEMLRMQEAMDAIQQSSNDISKIIKTIDEIAFQTNILALNAAVEAARAGEAGAGFAVVADEVRSLAQRSAVAAKETAEKIEDATRRSAQGVQLSARVAEGLQKIVTRAREVDQLVAEVAVASREQSEGLTQISTAITQMDQITQTNAANAEETASAAEELNAQSQELKNTSGELASLVGAALEDGAPGRVR